MTEITETRACLSHPHLNSVRIIAISLEVVAQVFEGEDILEKSGPTHHLLLLLLELRALVPHRCLHCDAGAHQHLLFWLPLARAQVDLPASLVLAKLAAAQAPDLSSKVITCTVQLRVIIPESANLL